MILEIELIQTKAGTWSGRINHGYYHWECSRSEAVEKLAKRATQILNKHENNKSRKSKAADRINQAQRTALAKDKKQEG